MTIKPFITVDHFRHKHHLGQAVPHAVMAVDGEDASQEIIWSTTHPAKTKKLASAVVTSVNSL